MCQWFHIRFHIKPGFFWILDIFWKNCPPVSGPPASGSPVRRKISKKTQKLIPHNVPMILYSFSYQTGIFLDFGAFLKNWSPVSGLRSPVSGLRSPVSGLRSPVSGLRSLVSGLRFFAKSGKKSKINANVPMILYSFSFQTGIFLDFGTFLQKVSGLRSFAKSG